MTTNTTLSPEIEARIKEWTQPPFDEDTCQAVLQMLKEGNIQALQDAFYKDLEFGTGGLRGIMGVGTNRMNRYTVGLATHGLALYLKEQFPNEQLRVAIAHDSRHQSDYFAQVTASVFSAHGIEVFLFDNLRPTPLLSFAIRELKCHSGVVITASHNPPAYNGYKAYWKDGAQLVAPHDQAVIQKVKQARIEEVPLSARPELIHTIGPELEECYIQKVCALSIQRECVEKHSHMPIVYTPLHGTGITLVPRLMQRWGFHNLHVVEAQAQPDGSFPTVKYPNPEEAEALKLAIELGKKVKAALILANDPDADRLGIAVPDDSGEYVLLNGNQTACLLLYYLAKHRKTDTLPLYIVKTIVSTPLIEKIAEAHGLRCYDTLTGFKNIAAIMRQKEGVEQFLMAAEESYGYLIEDFVRDKDGISACAMIAEVTAWAKEHYGGLLQLLRHIHLEYGLYYEGLLSITKEGAEGQAVIQAMMQAFREQPPKTLGGSPVVEIRDYLKRKAWNPSSEKARALETPASNVLQFLTEEGALVSVRPSGTEPKIKFYFSVSAPLASASDYASVFKQLQEKIKQLQQEMLK
jgi:phosphoglucomutase